MTTGEDLRSLVTIVIALHHASFVASTTRVEFTDRSARRMPGMMHCRQILCCDSAHPSRSASARDEYEQFKARFADLCRGDSEAFLIAHRSQMRLTADQQPASPCLD
jgi:hypothetical protein